MAETSDMQRVASAVDQLNGVFSARDVAKRAELPEDKAARYVRRLVERGAVRRVGRGLYSAKSGRLASSAAFAGRGRPAAGSQPRPVRAGRARLSGDAAKLAQALSDAEVPAVMSGLDAVSSYQNQMPSYWPLLVIAEPGVGDEVVGLAQDMGRLGILNPSKQVVSAAVSGAPNGAIVIVRERSLAELSDDAVASRVARPEDAWIDLVSEARDGFPISLGELAIVVHNMASANASWSRIYRAARRRAWPISFDPHRYPPIRFESDLPFWQQLSRELEAAE